jgi:predicted acylesterase/phospholipase RssA
VADRRIVDQGRVRLRPPCATAPVTASPVHRHGPPAHVLGGSMCLPGLAPPVVHGRRLLIDGGVLDDLPVTVMAAEVDGPIIASKANNSEAFAPDPDRPLVPPPLPETLYRLTLLGARDTVDAAWRPCEAAERPRRPPPVALGAS